MKEDYMKYEQEWMDWQKRGNTGKEPKKPSMQRLGLAKSLPEYAY